MCVVIAASFWCAFVCWVLGKVEPFSFQCHVHLTGRPRLGFSRGSFSAYKVQVEMELS